MVDGDGSLHKLLNLSGVGGVQHVGIGIKIGDKEIFAGLYVVLVHVLILLGHIGGKTFDGDGVAILAALLQGPVVYQKPIVGEYFLQFPELGYLIKSLF